VEPFSLPTEALVDGYTLRSCGKDEFVAVFNTWAPKFFHEDSPVFRHQEIHTPEELAQIEVLREATMGLFRMRLLVEKNGEVVGWHTGEQQAPDTYYMMNSAIFPEHRRAGLYSAVLARVLSIVKGVGFQRAKSRHRTMNNAIIIAKLRAGFHISGVNTDDRFGQLVELVYMLHPVREKVFAVYTQGARADAEVQCHVSLLAE